MQTRIRALALAAALAVAGLLGARSSKLSKEQQIFHVLNRLTYGPRPGDIAAVEKLGVKKWVEQQLNPSKIDENPLLAEKLAPLEALRLSGQEATRKYPSPQMLAQIVSGRGKMPENPLLRTAIERVLARRRQQKQDTDDGGAEVPLQGPPREQLLGLLDRSQIRTLRMGAPEEKRALLASFSEQQLEQLAIAAPPPLRMQIMAVVAPELRRRLLFLNTPFQVIASDLVEGKLYRALYSNRQLEQVLEDFWYNHFNVYLEKGADRFLVPSYERDAIRPHVLGKFRDLLGATAKDPAMLFYLDNWQSVSPGAQSAFPRRGQFRGKQGRRGLNENYARELMELHTLGAEGGYTQRDITEVARCFTGWTMRQAQQGGGYFFNARVHDGGEKVVLGVRIPAGGGEKDGERVLDILARHPSTAKFISRELAQKFISDDPPAKLIEIMSKTFLDKDGDLREVMRTMLMSDEFFAAAAYQAKIKTPFEMLASALRSTGANLTFAMPLANQLAQMGQPLYRKVEPTGFSNQSSEWVSSAALLARMNFALALARNEVPGVAIDARTFPAEPAAAAERILFHSMSPETRAAIEAAWAKQEDKSPAVLAGLILGSPEFQRR